MTTLASYIDLLLYGLLGLTAFLLMWKVRDCYFRPSTAQLQRTGASELDLDEQIESLESGLAVLATIASSGAFVGLVGTVLHIITALSRIKGAALDIGVISGPIATALYATVLGLASAIPAAIGHNLFMRRLQLIESRARRAFLRGQSNG